MNARGEFKRECSFPAAGGAEDYDQQRFAGNQRALQLM
jgi:hypothetical protein